MSEALAELVNVVLNLTHCILPVVSLLYRSNFELLKHGLECYQIEGFIVDNQNLRAATVH